MTESHEYLTNLSTKLLTNYCIPGAVLSRSIMSDSSQLTSQLSYYLSLVAFTQMVVHDSRFSIPYCFCLTIHESWRSTHMHKHTFPHFFRCTTILKIVTCLWSVKVAFCLLLILIAMVQC